MTVKVLIRKIHTASFNSINIRTAEESLNSIAPLDCLIIGAGPAGLTAATYLARFRRSVQVIDSGTSRARLVPASHNYPGFPQGISGKDLLSQLRTQTERYGVNIVPGVVEQLEIQSDGSFLVKARNIERRAKKVLLATGVVDIEPALPDLENAICRGFIRHCPVCDGYEVIDQKIAVIGHGRSVCNESLFLRTYTSDITVLTLGQILASAEQKKLKEAGTRIIEEPISAIYVEGEKIAALRIGSNKEYQFDSIYSALGCRVRSELAKTLAAQYDEIEALIVDCHQRTSVAGLYAAGDVVQGLNQICVATGQAAVAAMDIHNCLKSPG